MSQPARAVWIEIIMVYISRHRIMSQPARAVWIEIDISSSIPLYVKSQPARAVWIEIHHAGHQQKELCVTACEGCVD